MHRKRHWPLKILLSASFVCLFASHLSMAAEATSVPLHLFGNMGYSFDYLGKNNFYNGQLDLFLDKRFDDRFRFLSEIVFTGTSSTTANSSVTTELERVLVRYEFSQWFTLGLGRHHTGLGYWNETYHHGTFLQTSVSRPRMFLAESASGILPIHIEGLELRGNGQVGAGNLGYIANFGNGRGSLSFPVQVVNDVDRAKCIGFMAYYEMDGGLRFGPTLYYDTLPATATRVEGTELIYGGHIVYNSLHVEWLTEFFEMRHTYQGASTDTVFDMIYSQFGYRLGLLTPYLRFSFVGANHNDLYLGAAASVPTRDYILGARYETSPSSAAKLEFDAINNNTTSDLNWSINANFSFGL